MKKTRQTHSMSHQTDIFYVEQVLGGNTDAFSFLVEKYQDMVFGLCLKMLRNAEDAEELAQDSFVKAYRSLNTYKGTSKFSTWLYRIAYNSTISFMRKRKMEVHSLDEQQISDEEESRIQQQLGELSKEHLTGALQKAIESLPGDDQVLITLFYYEEQRVEEIAQITGLSESNVKVKIHRARKKMHILLKDIFQEEVYNLM